jgi:hypothetical protein
LTSLTPATVVKEPSAVAIFLLLGHGLYVGKRFGEWVIWSVAPECMIQELAKVVSETFKLLENENLPEYVEEQVPEGLSKLPIKHLSLSISFWLGALDGLDWSIFIDCVVVVVFTTISN